LFTRDFEPVDLHYLDVETYRCYGRCPGRGCPLCYLGIAPNKFALTPVFNIAAAEVQTLRIPSRRGIGSLFAGLQPVLSDPGVADKVALISRTGNRYTVRAQPLAETADHGEAAIARFEEDVNAGLKLSSAFIAPAAAELAEIPSIRRKLDAIGGYRPPTQDSDDPDA
jgi:hypothetical protein